MALSMLSLNFGKKIQRYIPFMCFHQSFYAKSLHLNAFINLAYLTLMLFTTGKTMVEQTKI